MAPETIVRAAQAMDNAVAAAKTAKKPFATRVRRKALSTRNAILLHWNECLAFCKTQGIPWVWGDTRQQAASAWIADCKAFGVRTVRETTAEEAPAQFKKYCDNLLSPN